MSNKIKIGWVGYGRMGRPMARNAGSMYNVIVYDVNEEARNLAREDGLEVAESLDGIIDQTNQAIVWLSVPAGTVDDVVDALAPNMKKGDIIIDGGNCYYKDSQRRYHNLKNKGISFLDVGVSGGLEGAENGASLMIGGDREAYETVEPLFGILACDDGYAYLGESGSGHLVKGIHNLIEYGIFSAFGEGFRILSNAFDLEALRKISRVYAHGSIIAGKTADFVEEALSRPDFLRISGMVPHGETEDEMMKLASEFSSEFLRLAIDYRKKTREEPHFGGQIISAIRQVMGGHKPNYKG